MARTKKEKVSISSFTEEQRQKLKVFKLEAFGYLAEIETAKLRLKEMVESASDGTGVDKAIITKFFNLAYKAEIDAKKEEMEVIDWFNN